MGAPSFQCIVLFDHHLFSPLLDKQCFLSSMHHPLGILVYLCNYMPLGETCFLVLGPSCCVSSRYIWELKSKGKSYEIKWSIMKRAKPYQPGTNHCSLCTQEKLCIINANKETLLNQISELISKCRHENKFYACNYKP